MPSTAFSEMPPTDLADLPPAPIGHNQAPSLTERLSDDYGYLAAEVEAIAARANTAPASVVGEAEHAIISQIVIDARKATKRLEAVRVDETAPFLKGQRDVMAFFSQFQDRLDRIAKTMSSRGDEYLSRKKEEERRQRAEQERLRIEAERRAREDAERRLREAAEAERVAAEKARVAREEQDRIERERLRLQREEEDRRERVAASARREQEERQAQEQAEVSRQKTAAVERQNRLRREEEDRQAAEAARERAEADQRHREATERAEAERRQAEAESIRARDAARAAIEVEEIAAAERREAERFAAASPADLSRTRAGGTMSSLKREWDFEVVDWPKLDLEKLRPYLTRPDLEKAVRAYVRTHKDTAPLDGVRIFAREKGQYR